MGEDSESSEGELTYCDDGDFDDDFEYESSSEEDESPSTAATPTPQPRRYGKSSHRRIIIDDSSSDEEDDEEPSVGDDTPLNIHNSVVRTPGEGNNEVNVIDSEAEETSTGDADDLASVEASTPRQIEKSSHRRIIIDDSSSNGSEEEVEEDSSVEWSAPCNTPNPVIPVADQRHTRGSNNSDSGDRLYQRTQDDDSHGPLPSASGIRTKTTDSSVDDDEIVAAFENLVVSPLPNAPEGESQHRVVNVAAAAAGGTSSPLSNDAFSPQRQVDAVGSPVPIHIQETPFVSVRKKKGNRKSRIGSSAATEDEEGLVRNTTSPQLDDPDKLGISFGALSVRDTPTDKKMDSPPPPALSPTGDEQSSGRNSPQPDDTDAMGLSFGSLSVNDTSSIGTAISPPSNTTKSSEEDSEQGEANRNSDSTEKDEDEEENASAWTRDGTTGEYFLCTKQSDESRKSVKWPAIRVPKSLFAKLYPHQKRGCQWIASMHEKKIGGILGDDMGMGKTFQTLTYLGGLMRARTICNALIVAPVSVLRSWEKEARLIVERCCVPRVTIYVISSDIRKQRRCNLLVEALTCSSDYPHLVITTYGLIGSSPLDFVPKEYETHHWDYVVLDEGHKIKNSSTKISKNCRRVCRNTNTRRLLLTGTPIQNNLKEMWSLFDFATSGKLLGKLPNFTNRFAQPIEDGRHKNANPWAIKTAEKAGKELQEVLRPHFLQRMKSSTFEGELPTKRELVVWTHLSQKQRIMYEDYVKGGRVESVLLGEVTSPLEAITWLKKLCGHPSLVATQRESQDHNDVDPAILINDSAKLQALVALIKRLSGSGHRTLIFSQSTRMLDIIQRALVSFKLGRIDGATKEKERQVQVDLFNKVDSNMQVLLLSTRAAGIGLTLTGADRAVIYDPSWNPADDSQAVDRCYRIGQLKNVTVYRLIAAGTVEEKMYEKQVHKDGIRRTILTEGGSATERYFDKADLRRLFELSPVGECAMLDKVKSKDQTTSLAAGGSGKPSFLGSHPSVVGISSHDLVYTRTVVDIDKEESGNECLFDGTPFKTVGRSQRALSRRKIDYGSSGNEDKENRERGNSKVVNRASSEGMQKDRSGQFSQLVDHTLKRRSSHKGGKLVVVLERGKGKGRGLAARARPDQQTSENAVHFLGDDSSCLEEDKSKCSEPPGQSRPRTEALDAKEKLLKDSDSLLRDGRRLDSMQVLLDLLESGTAAGTQKLELHKKISRLGASLGWL